MSALLVDDLAGVEDTDADTRQALRFLLLRGPARRVWPLVAMDSADLGRLHPWLDAYRTRILGHVADPRRAADLAGVPGVTYGVNQACTCWNVMCEPSSRVCEMGAVQGQ